MGKDLRGKELGVGISQQKDGLYVGRFVDRTGKRITKRFKKLQECRQWISDAEFTNSHSDINDLGDMLVDAWFEQWYSIKTKTVRANTYRNHQIRYTHHIRPVIGNMMLSEVKTIHCQQILNRMADKGYKSSSITETRNTLHNLFDVAVDNEIIPMNPCKKSIKCNIGSFSEKREALTIKEQQAFLKCVAGHQYENQYRFVLQTGIRTGELSGLKWSDIDFDNRVMSIKRTMEHKGKGNWRIGEPKSASGVREIPLTDEAIRILQRQRIKNAALTIIPIEWKDFVFLGIHGCPTSNSSYNSSLNGITKRAKIRRISMHILRHTFATRCIEAGMMPKTLQTILGHSNINITMNLYVHTTTEQMSKEIDSVSAALNVMVQ